MSEFLGKRMATLIAKGVIYTALATSADACAVGLDPGTTPLEPKGVSSWEQPNSPNLGGESQAVTPTATPVIFWHESWFAIYQRFDNPDTPDVNESAIQDISYANTTEFDRPPTDVACPETFEVVAQENWSLVPGTCRNFTVVAKPQE
jgi:hypothetical protein